MQNKRTSYLRLISTPYYIFLSGPVLLALTLAVLVYTDMLEAYPMQSISGTLTFLGAAVFAFCRYVSQYIYKKKLTELAESNMPLKKKMESYLSANILRWAIMEFAALFCIILVYLSGSLALMALTLLLFVVFMLMRPTTQKTLDDLHIDVNSIRHTG